MTASRTSLSRPYVLSTLAILVLSIASTLLGLLREGHYNEPAALRPRLVAQDAVVLAVAVPTLAVGLWYARGGSLRGRVVWLGALAFMTYVWASIAGQTAFNEFFLGYVALFALSLFTLVGGVATTDADAVRATLHGRISTSLYGAFLALVATGLALLWLSDLVAATLSGTPPSVVAELGPQATHTYVLDLGVVVPSLAIAAVWLRRSRAWGYVFAGVLLVMAGLLAPLLTAITFVDALGEYVTVTPPLIVGTILPPVVAAAFAVRFVRALGERADEPDERGGEEHETDEPGVDA